MYTLDCELSLSCLKIGGEEHREECNTSGQSWVCELEMWSQKLQVAQASEDKQKDGLQWLLSGPVKGAEMLYETTAVSFFACLLTPTLLTICGFATRCSYAILAVIHCMSCLHIHLFCILCPRYSTKRETTCSLCIPLQVRKLDSFASRGPLFCFTYVLKYNYLPFSTDSLNAFLFLLEYSLRK